MADENTFLFAVNLFVLVVCGVFFLLMPRLTRKSYLFGVIIPAEYADCREARAMKRRYAVTCVVGVLVLMNVCSLQFTLLRDLTLLATLYLPLLLIPVGLAAFIPNRKSALRLKRERGWHISGDLPGFADSAHSRGNVLELPWLWYVASFALVVAGFALIAARYGELPDMVAGHLGSNFKPTYFVEKTWVNVLMMPLVGAGTLALLIMTAVFIQRAKLQIDPGAVGLSFAQHRVYRRRLGHALGFLTLAIIMFIILTTFVFAFPDSELWGPNIFWIGNVVMFAAIALFIIVYVKTGQGGCKVKISPEQEAEFNAAGNRIGADVKAESKADDDSHWLLGMFYCNRDDKACIVENRFGTNLGFNYARLPVKIGLAFLLVGIVAIYAWATMEFLR